MKFIRKNGRVIPIKEGPSDNKGVHAGIVREPQQKKTNTVGSRFRTGVKFGAGLGSTAGLLSGGFKGMSTRIFVGSTLGAISGGPLTAIFGNRKNKEQKDTPIDKANKTQAIIGAGIIGKTIGSVYEKGAVTLQNSMLGHARDSALAARGLKSSNDMEGFKLAKDEAHQAMKAALNSGKIGKAAGALRKYSLPVAGVLGTAYATKSIMDYRKKKRV